MARSARSFRAPRGHCPTAFRRAFTLAEILIVLAILVVVSAVCWPELRDSLVRSQVQHAGKLVGTELLRCRMRAIETGAVWQFRFQPGKARFDIGRWPSMAIDPSSDSNADADPAVTLQEQPEAQDLPEGVTFFQPQPPAGSDDDSSTPSASPSPPPSASGSTSASTGGDGDDEQWAAPILFQPNGRSSNGYIPVLGQQNYYVDVELRGMLGSVAVGQAQQQPEDAAP